MRLVALLQLRAIQGRLGIDEALVLLPLLHRALALVGKSELQELTRLKAPALQVYPGPQPVFISTVNTGLAVSQRD